MAAFAIAGRDVVVAIANVISITAAIPVANANARPTALCFGIESSFRCAPSPGIQMLQFCADVR
jgi:hypothetical protein